MIRRLLSLAAGVVACWALFAAGAQLFLQTSPASLILEAGEGVESFWPVVLVAGGSFLIVYLFISRIGFFKRGWIRAGALAVALALCLFAALLMGAA